MAEGESPLKGAWQKLKQFATGRPAPTERPRPQVKVAPLVRLVDEKDQSTGRSLVNPIENTRASDAYINAIRDPKHYQVYPIDRGSVLRSSELGLEIDPRSGFFNTYSVLRAASERYHLPLVIYDNGDRHARLVVASPKTDPDRGVTRVPVYDPMLGNITEIEHPQSIPLNSRLLLNAAAEAELNAGTYDITYLNDPSLGRHRDSFLLNGKFAPLQRDAKNCVPYSFFVGAMMQALKPGDTPFKRMGIPQFQKDFGVRILARENITGVRPS